MRIVISSPDSMGDLILRQPLFAKLAEAGHPLLLLVRADLIDMARQLVPSAALLTIPIPPFSLSPLDSPPELGNTFEAVRSFAPDLLVLAPFEWTMFEERMAEALPDVPVLGFKGELKRGLYHPSFIRFARQAEVPRDMHEWDKNRHLCELILQASVEWARPHINTTPAQLLLARERLLQHGLVPDGYWVACLGEDPRQRASHLRNWTASGWKAVLSHAVEIHGWRFLLIGSREEQEYIRQLHGSLGDCADAVKILEPEGLDLLVGVTALSRGYLGRDTGPMHLAASLAKPVVAIFGGGNWPRFLPVTDTAMVLTARSPCRGCDWQCPLADAPCVTSVPTDAVIAALNEIAAGRRGQVTIREGPFEPDYVEKMASQMAEVARHANQMLNERTLQMGAVQAMLQEAHHKLAEARRSAEENQRTQLHLQRQIDDLCGAAEEEQRTRNQLQHQIAELSNSRWRKLGRVLRLAKPASFER